MCPLSLLSFMSLKTPSLGYPVARTWVTTANEEHEPFVVYEIFLKNFPTNFFKKIPANLSVLTKFHLFENSLGWVSGSSNFGTRLNMVVCRQK